MKRLFLILLMVVLVGSAFAEVKFATSTTANASLNLNTMVPAFDITPTATLTIDNWYAKSAVAVAASTTGLTNLKFSETIGGAVSIVSGTVTAGYTYLGVFNLGATVVVGIPVAPITLSYALANLTGDKGTLTLSTTVSF